MKQVFFTIFLVAFMFVACVPINSSSSSSGDTSPSFTTSTSSSQNVSTHSISDETKELEQELLDNMEKELASIENRRAELEENEFQNSVFPSK